MAKKYLKYAFKGTHPWDTALALLGDAAATAEVVRVHSTGSETHVYVAVDKSNGKAKAQQAAAKTGAKAAAEGAVSEVTLADVLKIG
jgi:hypothetical protein